MSYSGDPTWASPSGAAETTESIPASNPPTQTYQPDSSEERSSGGCVTKLLSIINLCLCALMAALGVLTIVDFDYSSTDDYSQAFVSVYMIVFAVMLALYEFMWWIPLDAINRSLRKNFGFLYGIKGKAAYLIFIAFLTIGLQGEDDYAWLKYTTGISFLAVGALHLFLWFSKPELVQDYKAPTSGFESNSGGDWENPNV
uniref:Uncharacterized protein n=1 Tax=Helicotheca tamesis TaxID=374047 RepID=A0A7S2MBF0_9STRA|mmetsp:Transcript_12964/g.17817  ORF Transcript_12964/g.17817 Transcript_12964/m.17817 type:complete len:200 (+) Transcript_12964:55-654(+)|eukprot:CAMPEP_0185729080 /NCGR_PEP_ID=MMETSP1171-20130828/4456_1 /TAXON_ID=374046 /ORGANISM="Helicotheca tamensis, Strain CCMP826" /LENGTH=199 /DNA_ID=CAMNT_0028397849 /DNA_START=40 /DNA_END=639 /DNA_ORIENTATION=-